MPLFDVCSHYNVPAERDFKEIDGHILSNNCRANNCVSPIEYQ